MEYADLANITWAEAERLLGGSVVDQANALLRCGFHGVSPADTVSACRGRLGPDVPRELRRSAILSLAHLTRITGTAPPTEVIALIQAAQLDDALRGTASDFFDDVATFAS